MATPWAVSIHRHTPASPFRFSDLLALQEKTLTQLQETQGQALLFAEVESVVTVGSRQQYQGVKPTANSVIGERGGNETWHGPGQWVCFIVSPLETFTGDSKGVRKAVYKILEHALEVTRRFVPEARIEDGDRLGIWSDQGKIVSVGIKIKSRFITSGFAMNCIPHPDAFQGINPCGIEGASPDFLFRGRVPEAEWQAAFLQMPALIQKSFTN